jgi:Raf kinase inhibitor-like YbhB/YbcL family protein
VVHVPASPAPRLAAAVAGCSSPGSPGAGASRSRAAPVTMKLTSSAFEANGNIPKLYTCDGQSISVPLAWSGAPKGTAWFAVTVIDPAGPVTHWYVIDIPATTTGIKQGASYSHSMPGKQVTSWGGMCPGGGPDAYEFTVYALPSSYKPLKTYAGYAEDEAGLAANAIGIGYLTGYYAD